jgi:hypothetical protein
MMGKYEAIPGSLGQAGRVLWKVRIYSDFFGLVARDGIVVECGPKGSPAMGRDIFEVKRSIEKRGGTCLRLMPLSD